ncbi:MAG: AbrB family looped-hinge helix DNA binding protein [Patescibacteria group bacterium]|jgi:AbrB family looped-hinge helix DNA binding protein
MGNVAITKMSSKGQIVIPAEMRSGLSDGERMFIIQSDGRFILKKASLSDEQFADDIEFANRTEEALERIDSGKFVSIDSSRVLEEMDSW